MTRRPWWKYTWLLAAFFGAGGVEGDLARNKPCEGAEICYCDFLKNTDPLFDELELYHTVDPAVFTFGESTALMAFRIVSNILMIGESIFYIDGEAGDSVIQSIRELVLTGYSKYNFISPDKQIELSEKMWPTVEMSDKRELALAFKFFQNETLVRLYFDVWQTPTQLWVDNNPNDKQGKAVWVDISATKGLGFNSSSIYFKDRTTDSLKLVPKTSAFLYRLHNLTKDAMATRFKPSVSGNYIAFSEHYPDFQKSLSIIFHIETGGFMTVGHTETEMHHVFLRVKSFGEEFTRSVAFWIATSLKPTVNIKSGEFEYSTGIPIMEDRWPTGTASFKTKLKLMFLPEWEEREIDYAAPDGLMSPSVWNVVLTSEMIFIQTCGDLEMQPTCFVQSASLIEADPVFTTIEESPAAQFIQFQWASRTSLLYWVGNVLKVHMGSQITDSSRVLSKKCSFHSNVTDTILSATVYQDIVLLVKSDGTLMIVDIDKDNDGIIDVDDAFPIDGTEYSDKDNDGVGDDSDLINFSAFACASSEEKDKCARDNVVLYWFFVCYCVALFSVIHVGSGRYYFAYSYIYEIVEEEVLLKLLINSGLQRNNSASSFTSASSNNVPRHFSLVDNVIGNSKESQSTASMKGKAKSKTKHLMTYLEPNAFVNEQVLVQEKKVDFFLNTGEEMTACRAIASRMVSNIDEFDSLMPAFIKSCHLVSRKLVRQCHPTLSFFGDQMQITLDFLSVVSLFTGYLPMTYHFTYGANKISNAMRYRIGWLDFFVSNCFFLTLINSYRWGDLSVLGFCISHWVELFAVISIPPGYAEYLTGVYYTVAQAMRLMIIFRIFRLYKRIFQEERLVYYIIMVPNIFVTALLLLLLCICAVLLVQVEINVNPEGLGVYANSLWFSAVTVTTVGYGDFSPLSKIGRIISIFMMIFGVGLVGSISGSITKAIQTLGSTDEKVKQLKSDNRSRFEVYKEVIDLSALPYNPVFGLLSAIFVGDTGEDHQKSSGDDKMIQPPSTKNSQGFRMGHTKMFPQPNGGSTFRRPTSSMFTAPPGSAGSNSSSSLKVHVGFPVALPVAEMICLNSDWKNESTLSKASEKAPARKKQVAKEKLVQLIGLKNGAIPPRIRIHLILHSFQLDEWHGISNFDEFANRLCKVMLEPPKQHEIVLERAFAIKEEEEQLSKSASSKMKVSQDFDISKYSLLDPIDSKLERMEKILSSNQYKLLTRVDYALLLMELTMILLEYDRLLTARWAYHNLEVRESVTLPRAKRANSMKLEMVKKVVNDLPEGMKQFSPEEFLQSLKGNHIEHESVPLLQPAPVHNHMNNRKVRLADRIRSAIRTGTLKEDVPGKESGVLSSQSIKQPQRRKSIVDRVFHMGNNLIPTAGNRLGSGLRRSSGIAAGLEISTMLESIQPENHEVEIIELLD